MEARGRQKPEGNGELLSVLVVEGLHQICNSEKTLWWNLESQESCFERKILLREVFKLSWPGGH